MNFETLNNKGFKKIAIGVTISVLLFSVLILSLSLAKYRNTNSINIAKGTINYKVPDLNTVALYLENDNGDFISADNIPTSGYTLNTDVTTTRCEVDKVRDTGVNIAYNNGKIDISGISKKGTKCYIYFDKIKDTTAPVIGVHEARNIEKTSMDLYVEATDDMGIAGYYFKLNSSSDWGTPKCTGQTSCTHSVTGLISNTSYTYDVKVCDGAGNCPTTTITQKTKMEPTPLSTILSGLNGITTNDSMFAGIEGNGVYTWTKGDYSGGSQPIKYFRGNVNDNWVVFGKDGSNYIWWRIIRNNSNGSLRMIYAGVSSSKTSAPATTGEGTQIGTRAFNITTTYDNMYVGFKYTPNYVHGIGTNSTILGAEDSTNASTLYGWYNTKLKTNYASYIDIDAGFCNDRTTYSGTGLGTSETYYAPYNRLKTNKAPSLLCPFSGDIFNTPVGLITADEVSMGGIISNTPAITNTSTYLYSNTTYWTMSPYYYSGRSAGIFAVSNNGYLTNPTVSISTYGVRPVINLKSNTLFEEGGTGKNTNPYIVIGT